MFFANSNGIGFGVSWQEIGLMVGAAVGFYLVWYIRNGAKLEERVHELTTRCFTYEDRLLKLTVACNACAAREESYVRRIARLESLANVSPDVTRSGLVVADLRGIIRVYSPSLVSFLKWLPGEVIGKPISVLMPDEFVQKHSLAFSTFVADEHRKTDPDHVILGEAKDKFGQSVPVAITLDGWQIGKEGLVTATIRERPSGESGAHKMPKPLP